MTIKNEPHPPPNDAKARSTVSRILQAAREEFAAYGFEGGRVDRLADRAGVNKAMIYYHFTSKDNLYREIIGRFFDTVATQLRREVAQDRPLEEVLTAVAGVYADLRRQVAPMRAVILRELASPRSDVVDRIAALLTGSDIPRVIMEKLGRDLDRGEIRPVDVRQTTLSFVLLNIGYLFVEPLAKRVFQVTDSDQFVAERKAAVVDLFLNGIRRRSS
jgi:AcrR family transcriptional regulator